MKFDIKDYLKEAGVFALIAAFVLLLTSFNLFSQVNSLILSLVAMEPAGYVGYYDTHYDAANEEAIEQIVVNLETDPTALREKQIFVLDKESDRIISSSESVSSAVSEQLHDGVNEKLIIIDKQTCYVVDFDHYKILVGTNLGKVFSEFASSATGIIATMLLTLVVALALLTLAYRIFAEGSRLRFVATIVLTLLVVFSFAGEALHAEISQIDRLASSEKETLSLDLEYMCNYDNPQQPMDKDLVVEAGNDIAKASITLKEVTFTGSEELANKTSNPLGEEFFKCLSIVSDNDAIASQKTNIYIQASLMLLLAFMLVYEFQKTANAKRRLAANSKQCTLTANDHRMRVVLQINGACMAAFNIVSVLRIRQVVMLNTSDNVAMLTGAIFTGSMLAGVLGSFLSSTVLRKCGNVKSYSIFVMIVCVIGAFMCGTSSVLVVFIVGIMAFNLARSQASMIGDFYSTLISDVNRKDRCQVEFSSGLSVGQVVGNIAGGVISVVVSYGFVQVVTAACILLSIVTSLTFNKNELSIPSNNRTGIFEGFAGFWEIVRHGEVLIYALCIMLPGSVAYILVQYKLPLDIEALGLTTVVLSFAMTMQKVVRVYSNPLYHVVSKRVSPIVHLTGYVALSGVVVLIYTLGKSPVIMIACVAALGFLNGIGNYATIKIFREMPVLANTSESDRMVVLSLGYRAGDAIAPMLFSAFGSGVALPIMVIIAPFLNFARQKISARRQAEP